MVSKLCFEKDYIYIAHYAFICRLIFNNHISQLMANRVGYHDNTYILICET